MSSDEEKIKVVRNATDLQRLKIEKLMKNPEKLAFIPEKSKDKKFPNAPEFVRNVMGSSAGAGSGEFHVYRHIRRREYARQEYLNQLTEKDRLDLEYREKLEDNRRLMEGKAAKKRAKRQRAKQRIQAKRRKGAGETTDKQDTSSDSEECSDDEDDDTEQNTEKKLENKKEEENPTTQEAITRKEKDAVAGERMGINLPESVVDESKGGSEESVEQNHSEKSTNETGNSKDALLTTETVSNNTEKPQKKSLKELLKTTASKLNLDLNIDR